MEGKLERTYTADLERDREHLSLLELTHALHRTSLYRTRRRLTEEYMRKLNKKIRERMKESKRLGTDTIGLRQSSREGAWSNASQRDKRGYVKLHAPFDLESGAIKKVECTPGIQHESPILPSLLDDVDDIEGFVADPGYLSRMDLRVIADKGIVPSIKPKKNSTLQSKGCWPWRQIVGLFRGLPRLFHRVCHLRPRMKARWHSLKSLVGDLVRSRSIRTIKTEIWVKIT